LVLAEEAPVMTGPEDEMAASVGGPGYLRASHADREQVIGVLKAAFVQGRLTKDELDARAGQTFTARTYGELAAVTADLPAGLAQAVPPRRADQPPMSNAAKAGMCVAIAVAVAVIVSIFTGGAAFQMFARLYVMALLAAGAQMLVNWHDNRSRRRQLSAMNKTFGAMRPPS
jgi:hypothetical protein